MVWSRNRETIRMVNIQATNKNTYLNYIQVKYSLKMVDIYFYNKFKATRPLRTIRAEEGDQRERRKYWRR